jgi:hypothetical protein
MMHRPCTRIFLKVGYISMMLRQARHGEPAGKDRRWQEEPAVTLHMLVKVGGRRKQWVPGADIVRGEVPEVLIKVVQYCRWQLKNTPLQ